MLICIGPMFYLRKIAFKGLIIILRGKKLELLNILFVNLLFLKLHNCEVVFLFLFFVFCFFFCFVLFCFVFLLVFISLFVCFFFKF